MSVVPFAAHDSEGATPQPSESADARHSVLVIKQRLLEAANEIESLQAALGAQLDLELLLKQGRMHLQELRSRLEQTAAERDRLQIDLAESVKAHQRDLGTREQQIEDLRAEQRTSTRLLDEASSIQRELTEEVQEQRQQIHKLREAAMRAQAFARDIIRAHQIAPPLDGRRPD
jgi:chromosome segregation ATPase